MSNQFNALKSAALAATPGPWKWWTSNSYLRLSAKGDGDVLHGARLSDGACTVNVKPCDQAFIAAANPAAILSLIAAAESAEAAVQTVDCSDDAEWLDQFAKVDGATAFHLIERHGEDWADCGRLIDLYAKAKAAAPQPVAVPEGWKLVPAKPTEQWKDSLAESGYKASTVIADVLAAAPAAPSNLGWACNQVKVGVSPLPKGDSAGPDVAQSPAVQPAQAQAQGNPHFATFPEKIWLQVGDCSEEETAPYEEIYRSHEMTWCAESIDRFDVAYVRADLAAQPAQAQEVRRKCNRFGHACNCAKDCPADGPVGNDKAAQPAVQQDAVDAALQELRRSVAPIGIVGQIDGHDVIRRDSVFDIIDSRIAAIAKREGV